VGTPDDTKAENHWVAPDPHRRRRRAGFSWGPRRSRSSSHRPRCRPCLCGGPL